MLDNTNNNTMSKLKSKIISFYHLYIYTVLSKVTELVWMEKKEVKKISDDFISVVGKIIHRISKLIMVVKTTKIGFHQIETFSQYHPFTINKRIPFQTVWMSDG